MASMCSYVVVLSWCLVVSGVSGVSARTLELGEGLSFISQQVGGQGQAGEVRALLDGVHLLRQVTGPLASTRLTNGHSLIHLVESLHGDVLNCHIHRGDVGKVNRFLAAFYRDIAKDMMSSALHTDQSEPSAATTHDQSESFLAGLTDRVFQYLSPGDSLLGELTQMADLRAAEDRCREFWRSEVADMVRGAGAGGVRGFIDMVVGAGYQGLIGDMLSDGGTTESGTSFEDIINGVVNSVDGVVNTVEGVVKNINGVVSDVNEVVNDDTESGRAAARSGGRSKRQILPGTNWCGNGDLATGYDDLGDHSATDQCCRVHDQCPYYIRSMTEEFQLFNYRLYTLLSCQCDDSFHSCLKSVNSTASNRVGRIFFDLMGSECFTLELERACVEKGWFGHCYRYQMKYVAVSRDPLPYDD